MELTKRQKENVLRWIAEGLDSGEINERAAKCRPPFDVSRQQVDYFRQSRGVAMKEIAASGEMDALREGLANRVERVKRLEKLFERVEQDLFENGLLWLRRERALGSGMNVKFVEVEELNKGEIAIYRELLDDIAKEVNQRTYERRDTAAMNKTDEPTGEVKITVAYEEKKQVAAE